MHPTLHELARAPAPRQPLHHSQVAPPRRGLRVRRDAALVHVGVLTVRVGHHMVAAGGRRVRHQIGAPHKPPDPHAVA